MHVFLIIATAEVLKGKLKDMTKQPIFTVSHFHMNTVKTL